MQKIGVRSRHVEADHVEYGLFEDTHLDIHIRPGEPFPDIIRTGEENFIESLKELPALVIEAYTAADDPDIALFKQLFVFQSDESGRHFPIMDSTTDRFTTNDADQIIAYNGRQYE